MNDLGSIIDSYTDWAEALRAFRLRNNLKQEAVANLLGVSQAYISKVENNAIVPSEALKERLHVLSQHPEHRPTLSLLRSMVRLSPFLTCLFSLRGGGVFVEAASRSFHGQGHPFSAHARKGLVDFSIISPDSDAVFNTLHTAGAFEGRLGYVEAVWTAFPDATGELRHFRTIFLPLRSDDGAWVLQANIVEISEKDLADALAAWDGPMRRLEHDEDLPVEWP